MKTEDQEKKKEEEEKETTKVCESCNKIIYTNELCSCKKKEDDRFPRK